jgi:hypothetical protein
MIGHSAFQASCFVGMDNPFGSGLVQELSGRHTKLLRGLKLTGGYRFSELTNGTFQLRLNCSVAISSDKVLTQTLFGSLGVWHLKNLLHYWILFGRTVSAF